MKKNDENFMATIKELKRQVTLSVGLCAIGGMVILKLNPILWIAFVLIVLTIGLTMVHFARRAIWLVLWRGFALLFGFGLIGMSGFYAFLRPNNIFCGLKIELIYCLMALLLVSFLLSVWLFYKFWIIPYWVDTIEYNLKNKIDTVKGTYSVVVEWARRQDSSGKSTAWLSPLVFSGPAIAVFLRGTGTLQESVVLLGSMFLIWLAFSMALIEFYNAYQLMCIEKKIGKQLIIDAYSFESAKSN